MKKNAIEIAREELFDVNMMITISVKVIGSAERPLLEAAFNKAISLHEVLNTRVVLDEAGAPYYEAYDQPESRLYYTDMTLDDLVHDQEKKRFHIENGEYLRLFVNDQNPNSMELHFLMHHTGGDGKSLCFFIESFLRSLNGESPKKWPLHLLTPESFPENSKPKASYRFFVKRMNNKWKKEGKVYGFDKLQEASEIFWQNHKTETMYSTIKSMDLKKMLEECHKSGITLTSRYVSDLLKETSGEQKVGLPVNLREKDNRSMGNLVAGIQIKYSYNQKLSVIENAKEIHSRVIKEVSNPRRKYFLLHFINAFTPSLLNAVLLESAGACHSKLTEQLSEMLHYSESAEALSDFNISNLGVLDIPVEYGHYIICDFWFIPPNTSYARDVIGMVTVNGRLNITRHRYEKGNDCPKRQSARRIRKLL